MALALDEQIIRIIIWVLYFVGLYYSLFWISILVLNPEPNKKLKRSKWPEITVLMPVHNKEEFFEMTLDSLMASDYPKDKLKVIAINDGSSDNTEKIGRELYKKYKDRNFEFISYKKNQGKSHAMNIGLEKVKSPYFACLDVDCFVDKDLIKHLVEEFDSPEVAAAMPIMKVYKPENILQRVQWLEYMMNIFYKYIMGKLDCIHVTPGPFSLYRTDYVKELGGFREAHLTEDLEMAFRLQNEHYKLKQSLEAVIYTATPETIGAFVKQRIRWYQGTLLNVADYKHFLFNRKYGDFGMFHMPLVGVTGTLTVLGVLTVLYVFLKEGFHTIKRWYLTNFDFWTYITNYSWNKGILDFDYQMIFLSLTLFLFIFITIYLSFVSTRERISILRSIKYFLMFLYFFIVYRFVMGYIWLKVLIKIIFRKANKWY